MNWDPFLLAPIDARADAPRSLDTFEGIGDRLRSAAFAEIQAREAFLWAADFFEEAPVELRQAWRSLALEEQKHFSWLIQRMETLHVDIQERRVSDQLWISLTRCQSPKEFALYMASAEERGRKAGIRFQEALATKDPISAQIFGKIAEEEVTHIALATQFFPSACASRAKETFLIR